MANLTVQVTVPVEEPKMCQKKPSIKFVFSESIITAFSLLIYLIDIVTGMNNNDRFWVLKMLAGWQSQG